MKEDKAFCRMNNENKDKDETSDESSENVSADESKRLCMEDVHQARASLTSDLSPGPTVGDSIANLAARFPHRTDHAADIGGDERDSFQIAEERSSTRKRPLPDDESELVPMPPPPKKSAATSAEHKRNREKQRRSELNETLDDLSELVFQIDPALRSGRAEEVAHEDQRMMSPGRKNTITNRTELIQCTVRLLKRIHAQNQQKDKIIADLGASQQLSSHEKRKGDVKPSSGALTLPKASNATASAAGPSPGDFVGRVDQSSSILVGPQAAYQQRMVGQMGPRNPPTDGHIHFGGGPAALPGLIFPGPFQGLLSGSSGSAFQGAPTHLLFGAAMGQQQPSQQQGHTNQFAPPVASSTGTSVDFRPFQTTSAALGHFPAPVRTRNRGQNDGKEASDDPRSDQGGR